MNTRTSFIFAAALLIGAPALRAGSPTITIWAGDEDQESKADKEQDLYDEGTDALDDHDWARAVKEFDKVARMKMSHAAAALFFKATAQANMGSRSEALGTLLDLQQSYPKSKWAEDGKDRYMGLGAAHTVTLPEAREKAREARKLRIDGTLVATPDIPSDDLIPSLLAASDVLGTGWFGAVAAEVEKPADRCKCATASIAALC